MSHVTTVSLEFHDLDCLAKAAETLGMELVRDVKTYKWYGRYMGDYNDPALAEMGITPKDLGNCDHVLRVKGARDETYEIGVRKINGSYRMLYDFWAGGHGLMEKVSDKGRQGKDINKLAREYTREVAVKQLRAKGMRVTERVVNGKRVLVGTR